MRYRKLDAAGDMMFGRGQADLYRDQPEAPAQAVKTRLMLWQGQWFLDLRAGMTYEVDVLGKYTEDRRDPVIREYVLATQGVTEIVTYGSQHNRDTREFAVQITINTDYGAAALSGALK